MSVAAAEATPQANEVYSKSLGTQKRLGEAILGHFGIETELIELSKDDFIDAVGEMIKTDPEYRHFLDVNKAKRFLYQEGKTLAADGTPMIDIVRAGYIASSNSSDSRISTSQAERDAGDVLVAETVDSLGIGESIMVVSMEPKTELAGKEAEFWVKQGYRSGIAYIQWYSRTASDELYASAISVDHSDFEQWKQLLLKQGSVIPNDVTPNTFIRQIHRFATGKETAQPIAEKWRSEYYDEVGASNDRISVTDFLTVNRSLADAMFDTYIPVLSTALVTRRNPSELKTFARQALQTIAPEKLGPEVRTQLMRIANLDKFDDAMARAMNEAILYATVEQLRPGLTTIVDTPRSTQRFKLTELRISGIEQYANMQQSELQIMAIAGLERGIDAQREYGGCSGTNVASGKIGVTDLLTPQDIFGGKESGEKEDTGPDGLGPLTFKCSEGHVNTRKIGELLDVCQTKPCKEGSVGCE